MSVYRRRQRKSWTACGGRRYNHERVEHRHFAKGTVMSDREPKNRWFQFDLRLLFPPDPEGLRAQRDWILHDNVAELYQLDA